MPLCGGCPNKKKNNNDASTPAQKVVIPKGMINPNETTIIEIPARLHKQPIVVAKRKNQEESVRKSASQYEIEPQRSSRSKTRSSANTKNLYSDISYKESYSSNNPAASLTNRSLMESYARTASANMAKKISNSGTTPSISPTNLSKQESYTRPNPRVSSTRMSKKTSRTRNIPSVSPSDRSNEKPYARNYPPDSPIEETGCYPASNFAQESSSVMDVDSTLDLDTAEEQERLQLQQDLETFQRARRKLIQSASKFASHSPGNPYDPDQSIPCKNYCTGSSNVQDYSRRKY